MYSEIYNKSEYDCIDNNDGLYESINNNPLHNSCDTGQIQQIKGILKNKYHENKDKYSNHNEMVSDYSSLILNYMLRFILIIVTLPFLFCDISFCVDSNQCVNIYPNNFIINFKIFLLVSAIFEMCIVGYNILYYCYGDNYKYLFLRLMSKIFVILLVTAYFIWNIIGVFIFGSVIYNTSLCSNTLYNYIIISIIIKIILSFIIIINFKL